MINHTVVQTMQPVDHLTKYIWTCPLPKWREAMSIESHAKRCCCSWACNYQQTNPTLLMRHFPWDTMVFFFVQKYLTRWTSCEDDFVKWLNSSCWLGWHGFLPSGFGCCPNTCIVPIYMNTSTSMWNESLQAWPCSWLHVSMRQLLSIVHPQTSCLRTSSIVSCSTVLIECLRSVWAHTWKRTRFSSLLSPVQGYDNPFAFQNNSGTSCFASCACSGAFDNVRTFA